MKIYATFQSVNARVEADYVGTAVNGDVKTSLTDRPLGGQLHLSHAIILLGLLVPFSVIGFALVITVIIACCALSDCEDETEINLRKDKFTACSNRSKYQVCNCKNLCKEIKSWKDKFNRKLEKSVDVQGNIAASAITCFLFAIYAQFLDIYSIAYEKNSELPSFFMRHSGTNYFFITITVFCAITVLVNLGGILLLFVSYCCCKKNDWLYISVILCIGNLVLVLSYHFQYILIAWTLTPFYAGSILLYYGVIIFAAFLSLKYTYICTHNSISTNRFCLASTLFIATVVTLFVVITTLMFIIFVPIDGSIENSAVGITTIYHGGVLLIGGLVAYNVGGYYFGGGSFSFNSVLKTAATEMRNNPFNRNDPEWGVESEEERMSKVVKMVIKYGNVYSSLPFQQTVEGAALVTPSLALQGQAGAVPTVYVTHIDNRTCALASPGLNHPFTLQSMPIIIDGFIRPSGIAVVQNQLSAQANGLQQGDVLVVEHGGNRVSKIVENNGQRQRRDFFGAKGGKDGQFKQPTGIAVDQHGNIFLVDHGNHRVQKFSQNSAVSGNGGRNDVADNEEDNVEAVTEEGEDNPLPINSGGDVSCNGEGNNSEEEGEEDNGEGAADERQPIISSEGRNDLQVNSRACVSPIGGWKVVAANIDQLQSRIGIAATQQKVYITDTGSSRIQVWDDNLNFTNEFGKIGKDDGEFKQPFDLSIDSHEHLYVVDRGNKRIQVFNATGEYSRQFGSDTLIDPVSIAIHTQRNDTVYVVDRGNNCVSKFIKDGEFIGSFSSVTLSEPSGIAVDHNTGAVYVCDTGNNRVVMFN